VIDAGECGCERSLTQLRQGERARVSGTTLEGEEAAVLRAMGLRPNASVRVCRMGEPCIVELRGASGACCRIGLARKLAACVIVAES